MAGKEYKNSLDSPEHSDRNTPAIRVWILQQKATAAFHENKKHEDRATENQAQVQGVGNIQGKGECSQAHPARQC